MKLSKFKPVSGIYKICNTKNGKIYIGQARNIFLRWANHVEDLYLERHANGSLLEDFQHYGINAFTVEIIEECDPEKKFTTVERKILDSTVLSTRTYALQQKY